MVWEPKQRFVDGGLASGNRHIKGDRFWERPSCSIDPRKDTQAVLSVGSLILCAEMGHEGRELPSQSSGGRLTQTHGLGRVSVPSQSPLPYLGTIGSPLKLSTLF